MFTLKHKFNSPQADGVDPTLVKPSDWNAEHDIEASTDGVFIGRPPGAGPGPMQELAFGSIMPSGAVIAFGGLTAPAGWLRCDGQIVNVSDYMDLFAAIGGYFGGNGISTFGIPDIRGRVIVSQDGGTGRITNTVANPNVPGGVGGTEYDAVNFGGMNVSVTQRGAIDIDTGGPSPPFQNVQDGFTGVATSGHNHRVTFSGMVSDGSTIADGNAQKNMFKVQHTIVLSYIIKT